MSLYVTDTHSLVFYFTRHHKRLSRRALRAFEQAERGEALIYVPAVALWEISRLEQDGAIKLNEPYEDWADALLSRPGFECIPLDEKVIAQARRYQFNRDVFDAAIVATAKLKDAPLITRDVVITDSGVVEIWW
jgi:PIN domain nuclease of toxin-antitoxin system